MHHGFLRVERLDNHLAAPLRTPGAACRLAQQLEQPLRTAEIGHAKPAVGTDNPHKAHARKIVPLRDHLRTEEDVVFTVAEGVENLLYRAHVLRGIAVHAHGFCARYPLGDFFLQLFDGAAHEFVRSRTARRAGRINRVKRSAIMAQQRAVLLVVNERHVAVPAIQGLAAFGTNANLGIAAAVHQHNRLFPRFHALHKCVAEVRRKQYSLLLAHGAHVYDFHFGERDRGRTLLEFQML